SASFAATRSLSERAAIPARRSPDLSSFALASSSRRSANENRSPRTCAAYAIALLLRQEERARQDDVADQRPLIAGARRGPADVGAPTREVDQHRRRIGVAVVAGALAPDERRLAARRREHVAGDRPVRVLRDRPAL